MHLLLTADRKKRLIRRDYEPDWSFLSHGQQVQCDQTQETESRSNRFHLLGSIPHEVLPEQIALLQGPV